jgi:pyridoxal phosphate enzyme (YggS family)
MAGGVNRAGELAGHLGSLRARLRAACATVGRDPAEITLIAVTKTYPASDVRLLAELGVTDVGENRDQEAAPKAADCADLPITWHFVGQLQTNKCRSVASYADVVHSVDRPRLVHALSAAAVGAGRDVGALVQVRLDDRPGRGGADPQVVPDLAAAIAAAEGLRLLGVMAVAPLDDPPGPAFERLAGLAAQVAARHPGATWISAGMTDDLEEAIVWGATHVRVGTALLGRRTKLR